MARRNGIGEPPRERAEEVYAAALRLFNEKGYHATSMQDIAAAVGLYKGSLYHYIGGKEDLLVQVFERAMGSLLSDIESIAADRSICACQQLRQVLQAHVKAVAANREALTVYLHEFRALTGSAGGADEATHAPDRPLPHRFGRPSGRAPNSPERLADTRRQQQ